MIHVSADVTATRMWWSQCDTYKFIEKNSTSTMFKLLNNNNKITLDHIDYDEKDTDIMIQIVSRLEKLRVEYKSLQKNEMVKDKQAKLDKILYRAKTILPEGFLQMRTIDTNYAELRNIYKQRKNHRLPEWHQFCDFIESLPYAKELLI